MNYYDRDAAAGVGTNHQYQPDATGTAPTGAVEDMKQMARKLAAHCSLYRGAQTRKAVTQIITTAVPFLAVVAAMFYLVERSYTATLLLSIIAGGLLVRFFIIQHDCGHGSFLPTRKANDTVGRLVSILTVTPYGLWRRAHAQHHASSGNLDKRGVGDIETLTVSEYLKLTTWEKVKYRFYRNPAFLFLFGVPFFFLVLQRLPWGQPFPVRETWRSVVALDLAIILVYGLLAALLGLKPLMMVALPMIAVASCIGGWLFFIQHQFEDAHWDESHEWDFQIAAISGSSYYVLPKVLQWFTGNIGLHHIHHLCSMIPNYRLQECLDASPEFQNLNRLTLWESFKCARLTLWDESKRKMIGFRELRNLQPA